MQLSIYSTLLPISAMPHDYRRLANSSMDLLEVPVRHAQPNALSEQKKTRSLLLSSISQDEQSSLA